MRDAFIGVDVCFAKRKPLPIVVCTWQGGRLVPEPLRRLRARPPRGHGNAAILDQAVVDRFCHQARSYVLDVCCELDVQPQRIAIDAPSSPCSANLPRRRAEQAMDAARISCFATPTQERFRGILKLVRRHLDEGRPHNRIPHANQLWMLVGFRLFAVLADVAECIEVFPQATARLLGAANLHKSRRGAIEAQFAAAAVYTGWPIGAPGDPTLDEIGYSPAHDRLDAYLSAWVAALGEEDRVAHGNPPRDVIWVPKIKQRRQPAEIPIPRLRPRARTARRKAKDNGQRSRQCPACDYVFKLWPLGWDAHAAHKCRGLTEKDPDERKREYKSRFRQLFKN